MQKQILLETIGTPVILARRKGSRSLRLTIRSDGRVRLTIPYGVSEGQAVKFLEQKSDWIIKHQKPYETLRSGTHVGKSHRLNIEKVFTETIKTRLLQNEVRISIPEYLDETDPEVQKLARIAAERALKKEAAILLPQRLEALSKQHKLPYKSVAVKKLKSRWGSCDTKNNIVLNIYLMQLDWGLIDYVLLHELTHTVYKHHQSEFWDKLGEVLPDFKNRRKSLKAFPTSIIGTNF